MVSDRKKIFNLPKEKMVAELKKETKVWSEESKQRKLEVRERIAKGAKWLAENQDHPKYAIYLKEYEKLVDEARRGGDENPEKLVDKVVEMFTGGLD